MKEIKGLPIYVLAASLIVSSFVFSNNRNVEAPNGVTTEKYQSDMKILATEVVKLDAKVSALESCVSDTTRYLTMHADITRWCP